ncbi:MAG: ABC transporter permease [Candidatus Cryptobacteroides sp.]
MKAKKVVSQIYLWLVLAVLYAPIIFIAIFSFTQAKSLGNWTGFTLDLYKSLFTGATSGSQSLMEALKNTLFIALVASLVSTVLGTLAAIGIFNMRGRWKKSIQFLNNVPMLNPDIITGVSLFLLFVFLGVSKGYTTIILSHITFCTPYVVLNVMPKLVQMNPNIYDAALDLGANPFQAMMKVIIPQLKTGMLSGFILAFTMSLDDFAVTYFTAGSSGIDTLSTFIYADVRKGGLTPELKPMMTIIFLLILVVLLFVNLRAVKNTKKS